MSAGVPPLWATSELVAVLGDGARTVTQATGVAIDSRTLERGDLFFAIKGDRLDGHEFVDQALAAGAAGAVVARGRVARAQGPLIEVEDTLAALNALGRAARQRARARIAAVTGSVGKTGAKDALKTVLGAQGATHASEGSLNNHWGAPLSLARLRRDAAYGVFELGMNHPGEITPLTKLVEPHVVLTTWIAPAHTEFFRSVAEIADAKAEIFLGARGGTAVLPRDSEHYERLRDAARRAGLAAIVSFGRHAEADARLIEADLGPVASEVTASFQGLKLRYTIGAPGRHWAANSLGILATAQALGADLAKAAASMAEIRPPKGRGVRHAVPVEGGAFVLIDESYNASPEAVRAALEALALIVPGPGGRRIAVLGDMRELGAQADALHAALTEPLAAAEVDLVLACGPHMAALMRALPAGRAGAYERDAAALLPHVTRAVRAGDVVVVKGSLGSRMAPIVDALLALGAGRDTNTGSANPRTR